MRRLITLFVLFSSIGFGQTPDKRPEFDVVDIKLNISGSADGVGEILPSGQFRAINIPVREIVKFAYNVRDEAVVGAPAWLNSVPTFVSRKSSRSCHSGSRSDFRPSSAC
jgi:hypothetical protein